MEYILAKFKLLHPDTEVIGQMVIDFEQAVNSSSFMPILEKSLVYIILGLAITSA